MRTDYQPKVNEKHLVHVEFMKIRMVGKETERFHKVQMFHPREWDRMKKKIGGLGLNGTTGQDEMKVLYDPRIKKAAEVKPEGKPKGRPPKQKEE